MVGGFTSMGIGSENAPNCGIYGNDVEHEHCWWMCIGQSYAQCPDIYYSVTLVKRKKETEGRLSFIGKVLLKKMMHFTYAVEANSFAVLLCAFLLPPLF